MYVHVCVCVCVLVCLFKDAALSLNVNETRDNSGDERKKKKNKSSSICVNCTMFQERLASLGVDTWSFLYRNTTKPVDALLPPGLKGFFFSNTAQKKATRKKITNM